MLAMLNRRPNKTKEYVETILKPAITALTFPDNFIVSCLSRNTIAFVKSELYNNHKLRNDILVKSLDLIKKHDITKLTALTI